MQAVDPGQTWFAFLRESDLAKGRLGLQRVQDACFLLSYPLKSTNLNVGSMRHDLHVVYLL